MPGELRIQLKGLRIGVIAGGVSAEREVSLKSGEAVYNALLERGYNAIFIDMGDNVCEDLKDKPVDVAFIVLHGGWGEDGSIQGMLEIMGIPYTGSGVLASALAMDKEASKKMFVYHGLTVPPCVVGGLKGRGAEDTLKAVKAELSPPWVVKPVREGSSVGVSIAETEGDLGDALTGASRFGGRVMVETYIKGAEVQIGILGDRVLGGVEVRPKSRFYDYKAKYTPGFTEYVLPPGIDEKLYCMTKESAYSAHSALGCTGATRVDLLIDDRERVYVLEVNTIPGMTETSLLPKIAGLSGYDFTTLIEEILIDGINNRV
ncbi:D-alanine--D-alanine ligase [bacterium BMS3Bbin06]|nr:D-alanine--D-alanine ligase [bacterium BMS3Abin08]GBE34348.1 D-alanine--D-alanine ligase [bacterium BMS3Bbin06]HDO35784.1 D-alanine--D-alanine ligase [Nitrospirota bacterium]HDY71333.1 D-alanine--D-alanine ligase [Nitrospirota bacterium]